jgi:hypothetical protein
MCMGVKVGWSDKGKERKMEGRGGDGKTGQNVEPLRLLTF